MGSEGGGGGGGREGGEGGRIDSLIFVAFMSQILYFLVVVSCMLFSFYTNVLILLHNIIHSFIIFYLPFIVQYNSYITFCCHFSEHNIKI